MKHVLALTTKNFVERAQKIHGNKYNYSDVEYVNGRTKVKITCPIHGNFNQLPTDHLHGSNCPQCAKLDRITKKTKTNDIFIEQAKHIHNNKYDYSLSAYIGAVKKIEIICPTHGIFHQTPADHLSGHGCSACAADLRGNLKRKSVEKFISEAKEIHGNKYEYIDVNYKNSMSCVSVYCKKHHIFFEQRPNSHISKKAGCPRCSVNISKKEFNWLNFMNVPDTPVHRQSKIYINNRFHKVDGFDPETNTVYEFWGDYWHGNPAVYNPQEINKNSKKTFGYLYETTLRKRTAIISAGYNLVEIWESEWDKIKGTLKCHA